MSVKRTVVSTRSVPIGARAPVTNSWISSMTGSGSTQKDVIAPRGFGVAGSFQLDGGDGEAGGGGAQGVADLVDCEGDDGGQREAEGPDRVAPRGDHHREEHQHRQRVQFALVSAPAAVAAPGGAAPPAGAQRGAAWPH